MLYVISYMLYVLCYIRKPITGTNISYYLRLAWTRTKTKNRTAYRKATACWKRHTKATVSNNAIQENHCMASRNFFKYLKAIRAPFEFQSTDLGSCYAITRLEKLYKTLTDKMFRELYTTLTNKLFREWLNE